MSSSGMLCRVALVRTDVSGYPSPQLSSLILVFLRSVRRLLVTAANVVPSSPILVTLMIKALCSSETSVLTRATRRNIPEDTILHHTPSSSFRGEACWRREGLRLPLCSCSCSCSCSPRKERVTKQQKYHRYIPTVLGTFP
jgi:hypothetical protein